MRQQHVVVLGQEAHRHRRRRVGTRRTRNVEQLASALIDELHELVTHGLERGRKSREPRPRRHVRRTRRPERGEVAGHELGWRECAVERPPSQDSTVATVTWLDRPHIPRGGTCTSASRLRHANASAAGSSSGNSSASAALSCGCVRGLGGSAAPTAIGAVRSTSRQHGREVAMVAQLLFQHRLRQRPDRQAVGGGEQMDRAADRRRAHDAALDQQRVELRGVNPSSRDHSATCGLVGHLRLQPERCSTATSGSSADRASSS